jgi:hypothetical protein
MEGDQQEASATLTKKTHSHEFISQFSLVFFLCDDAV